MMKKKRETKILTIVLTTLLTLLCIAAAAAGMGYQKLNDSVQLIQPIAKEEIETMENEYIKEETKKKLKENWMVAIFGIDSRDASALASANSDVILLVSINSKNGAIKLASVYRDTCLKTGDFRYRKANEAYARGGPAAAVQMLNENLDLEIDDYLAVNWSAAASAINLLGGTDIELSKKELRYLNAYITETVKSTKIPSTQLKNPGKNHLDGVQTVAYCRLRNLDNDFNRTKRQREILKQLFKKVQSSDWATINNLIQTVFPQTASSIDTSDIITLGRNIFSYHFSDMTGFPFSHKESTVDRASYVFPDTLEENVSKLHTFLYGDTYIPSENVKRISDAIELKSGKKKLEKKEEKETTEETIVETTAAEETIEKEESVAEEFEHGEEEIEEEISSGPASDSQAQQKKEPIGPGHEISQSND